ncbi:ADP-ribosylglycohydrolase family protein [Nocardia sp. NPDC005366]|uniref:ADP-ribosylglycohydrolase family protein n=1 Tax=Nocardia sp. NPDC005366 TaxID=3156878 RepID=UPI0033B4906B
MDQAIESAFFGRLESDPRALLYFEWRQRLESGYAVAHLEPQVRALVGADTSAGAYGYLLDRLEAAPRDPEWLYDESEPGPPVASVEATPVPFTTADLFDRVHGGWLGRCVGCALGKPLENGFVWTPRLIRDYLERAGAYPLTDFVPAPAPPSSRYPLNPTWTVSARGRIDGAPRDDDIDYTVLGLHLLETHGIDFTTAQVAVAWLEHLPYLQTYTAERVAYRNLVDGRSAPRTALHRNPYREWIGALIRADIYGYVSPGDPALAAALAARDAYLSHTGNGVHAARWAAALIASAFTVDGPREAVEVALCHIPPRTRLATAVADVLDDHRRGVTWEDAVAAVHRRHGDYNWVHAVPNACLITAGLLWGDGDFTRTIAKTVQGGCDTDSNGATAGSVAGILVGAAAIPAHWTDPFHDRLHTAVFGYEGASISGLARRTCEIAVPGIWDRI